MDPTHRSRQRQFLRLPTGPATSFNKYAVGVLLSSALFVGTLGSTAADALIVYLSWDERNAVRADVPIFDHRFETSEANDDGTTAVGGYHHFKYRYGDSPEAAGESSVYSTDPNWFGSVDRIYTIGPDTKIPVFYVPRDPRIHTLFIDPAAMFWESAHRVVWAVGILVVGQTIIVVMALRRNVPEQSF
jgi:hypothetical protein